MSICMIAKQVESASRDLGQYLIQTEAVTLILRPVRVD